MPVTQAAVLVMQTTQWNYCVITDGETQGNDIILQFSHLDNKEQSAMITKQLTM